MIICFVVFIDIPHIGMAYCLECSCGRAGFYLASRLGLADSISFWPSSGCLACVSQLRAKYVSCS